MPFPTTQQQSDLDAALREALSEISSVASVPSTLFASIEKIGAHGVICEFLKPDGGFSKELLKLHQAGKLPLSIESLVLKPEWKDLFDEHLLLEASNRINEVAAVID